MKECYADHAEFSSAVWRLQAIGPLLEQPELAPWISSRAAECWEIDDSIFLTAATAPLTPDGTFHVEAFCVLLRYIHQRAADHPNRAEETPDV